MGVITMGVIVNTISTSISIVISTIIIVVVIIVNSTVVVVIALLYFNYHYNTPNCYYSVKYHYCSCYLI